MNSLNDYTNLGLWSSDDLVETASLTPGVGADSDLPNKTRFLAGVAKLIKRRLAEHGSTIESSYPAVFLLQPTISSISSTTLPLSFKRVPMLDNGLTPVAGRLWFVPPVVVYGYYIDFESYDDDQLFKMVTDELKLGDVPAIVFDPRTRVPEVRFYPEGLMELGDFQKIHINHANISLESIFENIDIMYNNCLVTPEAQGRVGKLWENPEKFIPVEGAESIVQHALRIGLSTAFPTCTVRQEQTDVAGRLDLEIEEQNPSDFSNVTRHAILELKVLRSYTVKGKSVSENDIFEWVEKGVNQAFAYRESKGALTSALCCFDMRKVESGQKCFANVTEKAKDLKVTLKLWFIYATSEQYRKAISN